MSSSWARTLFVDYLCKTKSTYFRARGYGAAWRYLASSTAKQKHSNRFTFIRVYYFFSSNAWVYGILVVLVVVVVVFFLLMLSFLLFCCLLFDLILCDYFCKVSTLWGYKWKRWRCVRNNVYAYVYVWLSVVHLDNNVTQQRRQLIIIAKWHCTWKVCSVHVYKSPLFSAQKLTNRNYLPSLKMRCKENYHQLFMNFPLRRFAIKAYMAYTMR